MPEFFERLACALSPADGQPIGHYRSVHCAGAGRADPLDLDARVFHEPVEYTPSERAMSTAALESQADTLHLRDRWSELAGWRLRGRFRRMQIYRDAHGFAHFLRDRTNGGHH